MKKNGKGTSNDSIHPALKQEFRNLGALLEDNNHKISAIAEQYGDINKKLDSHTEMIGGLAVRMTSMEVKMVNMEMNIAVMREDIEFIKSGMKRKVDQDEFDALIRRVSVLEKRVIK
jgi:predicted  nucleic acid-binding Zn-ribbon protein